MHVTRVNSIQDEYAYDSTKIGKSRLILRLLLAILLLGIVAAPFIKWASLNRFEDYLITLRYARNAAEGHGAVFSEGKPFQGYTSPLQFCVGYLLCSVFHDHETVPTIVCLLGLFSLQVFSVNISWWITKRLSYLALFATSCLLLSSQLIQECIGFPVVWACGLGSLSITLFCMGRLRTCGIFLALTVLCRHDGWLLAILLTSLLLYKRNLRRLAHLMIPLFALTLPWYAFATWYYGSPLPRTLSIKIQQGPKKVGWFEHVLDSLQKPFDWYPLNSPLFLVIAGFLILLSLFFLRRINRKTPFRTLIKSTLSRLLYSPISIFAVWIGMHFIAYFAIMGLPLNYPWYYIYEAVAILAAVSLVPILLLGKAGQMILLRKKERSKRVCFIPTLVLSIVIVSWTAGVAYQHYKHHIPRDNPGRYKYAGYRAAAEWINNHARSTDIVRIAEVGVFGWYCPLNIEDTAGLTAPKMPVDVSDFRFSVWSQRPDSNYRPNPFVLDSCYPVASFPTINGATIYIYIRL